MSSAGRGLPLGEVNVIVFAPNPVPPFGISVSLPVTVTLVCHGTSGIVFNVSCV